MVNGIVDLLEKNNIKAFGPTRENAKLEGSKIYSKKVMKEYNIPQQVEPQTRYAHANHTNPTDKLLSLIL